MGGKKAGEQTKSKVKWYIEATFDATFSGLFQLRSIFSPKTLIVVNFVFYFRTQILSSSHFAKFCAFDNSPVQHIIIILNKFGHCHYDKLFAAMNNGHIIC